MGLSAATIFKLRSGLPLHWTSSLQTLHQIETFLFYGGSCREYDTSLCTSRYPVELNSIVARSNARLDSWIVGPNKNNSKHRYVLKCRSRSGSPIDGEASSPRVTAFRKRRRTTPIPSPSYPANNTKTMSSILRKRPPSSGGTPSQPTSCEVPHYRHLLCFSDKPQPRDNGSLMLSKCCWILPRNLPMRFHLSRRVWVESTH